MGGDIYANESSEVRELVESCLLLEQMLEWTNESLNKVNVCQSQMVPHKEVSELQVLLKDGKAVPECS